MLIVDQRVINMVYVIIFILIFICILILLVCVALVDEFLFPIPFHRCTKYRVVKSTEVHFYGRYDERAFETARYIIQRKLLLFYFEFDITACKRKDGELDYFGNQRDYNLFNTLENAITFIKRYKEMEEQKYQLKKNKKKDEVVYKD